MGKYSYNESFDLTLDNLLDIIKYFGGSISDSVKVYKEEVFHLESPSKIDRMRQFLALEETGAIKISNLKFEQEERFKNFEKYIEKYRLYEEKDIIYHLTKKPSFIQRIKNKLKIPHRLDLLKIINNKEEAFPTEYYSTKGIYRDWDNFKESIPRFAVFECEILIYPPLFFQALFDLVYQEEKDSVLKVARELFENISSETGGKRNYRGEITIFYPIKNYLDKKSSIYPILHELQEKEYLNISKTYIEGWNMFFVIENINNLSLKECEKAYRKICRKTQEEKVSIEFKDNELYINNEIYKFKSKKAKNYQAIKLYFELSARLKKKEVSFIEIEQAVIEGSVKLPKNTKYDYDTFRLLYKDTNKKISEEYFLPELIGANKNAIYCNYIEF